MVRLRQAAQKFIHHSIEIGSEELLEPRRSFKSLPPRLHNAGTRRSAERELAVCDRQGPRHRESRILEMTPELSPREKVITLRGERVIVVRLQARRRLP